MTEQLENQSIKQKMMAFAGSPDSVSAMFQILKDCMDGGPLIGATEYETLVNAVKFDVQAEMFRRVVDRVEYIRQGGLHEIK